MWVLGIEPGSFGRTANALNHRTNTVATQNLFKFKQTNRYRHAHLGVYNGRVMPSLKYFWDYDKVTLNWRPYYLHLGTGVLQLLWILLLLCFQIHFFLCCLGKLVLELLVSLPPQLFFFFSFFPDRISLYPWLSWNLICTPGWPYSEIFCLCLQVLELKMWATTAQHPLTLHAGIYKLPWLAHSALKYS